MKRRTQLLLALLATVLWLWFIYGRSAKPAALSHQESEGLLVLFQKIIPQMSMLFIRKLAHFGEYFLLGVLLWLDWRLWGRGSLILPLGVGLLFAAADEFLQTFIPGRSGELSDVLLDFFGVCCGVLLLWLLQRRRHIRFVKPSQR